MNLFNVQFSLDFRVLFILEDDFQIFFFQELDSKNR